MWGGLGYRKFYFTEVERIERKIKSDQPTGGYSPEEISAGYQRLADKYGFYSTLLFMEKETGHKRSELLGWSVAEFYYNFNYIAWSNHIGKKYSDIIKDKK